MSLIEMTKGTFENRFFNFMREMKIDTVMLHYSGGGDNGGIDKFESLYSKDCKLSEREKKVVNNKISENFEEELGRPMYTRHGSFADGGGFNVNGTVTWDATSNTVMIGGTEHFHEYDDDGEEENHSSSDWEDVVYEHEVAGWPNPKITSYDVLCFYANNFLRVNLPEEINNRILMAAAHGDEYAKEFISSRKND